MDEQTFSPERAINHMRREYSMVPRDHSEKIIECLHTLIEHARVPGKPLREFLDEVARYIDRLFEIREVAIGLRSPRDGKYRYESLAGFTARAEASHRSTEYTEEEFLGFSRYGRMIGDRTEMHFSEEQPWTEEERALFNLPSRIGKERQSMDESIEGDYIDIFVFGRKKEIIGWIELSMMKSGRFPSMSTIKCIEIISEIIATALDVRGLYHPG